MTKTNDTINPSHYWGFDGKRGTGMTTDEYWHTIAESYREKPQEPCEDAISRQAALDAIFNNAEKPGDAYRAVRMLTPVTPKHRTGHWIDTGSGQMCSECGEIQCGYDNFRRFCASCGARMSESEDNKE